MKTRITIITAILISILTGCSSKTSKASGNPHSTCVYEDDYRRQVCLIKVRGHEYLISYTSSSYGGTCMIHAAHCACHQNK